MEYRLNKEIGGQVKDSSWHADIRNLHASQLHMGQEGMRGAREWGFISSTTLYNTTVPNSLIKGLRQVQPSTARGRNKNRHFEQRLSQTKGVLNTTTREDIQAAMQGLELDSQEVTCCLGTGCQQVLFENI